MATAAAICPSSQLCHLPYAQRSRRSIMNETMLIQNFFAARALMEQQNQQQPDEATELPLPRGRGVSAPATIQEQQEQKHAPFGFSSAQAKTLNIVRASWVKYSEDKVKQKAVEKIVRESCRKYAEEKRKGGDTAPCGTNQIGAEQDDGTKSIPKDSPVVSTLPPKTFDLPPPIALEQLHVAPFTEKERANKRQLGHIETERLADGGGASKRRRLSSPRDLISGVVSFLGKFPEEEEEKEASVDMDVDVAVPSLRDEEETGTLAGYLANQPGRRIPETEAFSVASQLLAALHALHSQGSLHLQIRPATVALHPCGTDAHTKEACAAEEERSQPAHLPNHSAPCNELQDEGEGDAFSVEELVQEELESGSWSELVQEAAGEEQGQAGFHVSFHPSHKATAAAAASNSAHSCFMAPEVLAKELDGATEEAGDIGKKADIWSMGVLLHVLLFGRAPYSLGHNGRGGRLDLLEQEITFSPGPVSKDARRLMVKMLSVRPSDRPAAYQCLSHRWLTNGRLSMFPCIFPNDGQHP